MTRCPMHTELRLKFNATLFGQLCALIEHVNVRWIPLNEVNFRIKVFEFIKHL